MKSIIILHYLNVCRDYRKAAVFETFLELDLKNILKISSTAEALAEKLGLNSEALSRFLYVAANLELIEKHDNQCTAAEKILSYSKESIIVLFWFMNNKIADKLKSNPLSLDTLIKLLPNNANIMIEAAIKYNLLIRTIKNI